MLNCLVLVEWLDIQIGEANCYGNLLIYGNTD